MVIPENLAYCTVVGKFQIILPDSDDTDDLPDFSPMYGSGVITPLFDSVTVVEEGYESFVYSDPIYVYVDSDGSLSQGPYKYVKLLAPSSALSDSTLRYSISLTLRPVVTDSPEYFVGPIPFNATPNGTIDLADLTF